MRTFFLTLLTGIVAGIIDVAPMIKMKLDKHASISAFVYYLFIPFVIFNLNLFDNIWWIKGGIVTFILALPVIILVAKEDRKGTIPIVIMSVVLGSLIGIVGRSLRLM